jgi:hypothetical protein
MASLDRIVSAGFPRHVTQRVDSESDRLAFAALRAAESTGRALGSSEFVAALERATGRRLRPKRPGRKPSAPTEQLQLRMPGISSDA